MELLVFGHAGARVLVFPTREGRFFDYENWGLVNALAPSIGNGSIQLYCVDSIDSETFYCRHCCASARIARHNQYEQYILQEVLPFSHWKNRNPFLIAHGCSIGAFHAANIAFRHPYLFGKVVALSGRYDLSRQAGPFEDLFQGEYNQDIYFNTPNHFIPNLHDGYLLDQMRRMQIVLVVGDEDPFLESNFELNRVLQSKGILNTLSVWGGEAHRPRYWRQMVRQYL